MLAAFIIVLLFTGGNASNDTEAGGDQQQPNQFLLEQENEENCSYWAVLKHLKLIQNKEMLTIMRPVRNHALTTSVKIQMMIFGILDVREIDQTLSMYIWVYMKWENAHLFWKSEDFCGIESVSVPTSMLWKPDITIEEMIEKDKAPPSLFLTIHSDGDVIFRNEQVVVSTCKMQVYKFPFDIQTCNISFRSSVYSEKEVMFYALTDTSRVTEWTKKSMRTQFEWLFLNLSVETRTVNIFEFNQSMVVYTIAMKRRSVLYIVNFLLPVMFFLIMDMATFLMSDTGGEKLGFKITVLLAVTVMQLILKEILPSSSDKIPLIAVYCIGIFTLMMISLLETILVMYLLEKDQSPSEDCEDNQDKGSTLNCTTDAKKWTRCECVSDTSVGETPSELLSVAKQGSSTQLTEENHALEKVSDDLRGIEKTLSVLLKRGEGKPGYWCKLVEKINKVFFICYVAVTVLFLVTIFTIWLPF